MITREPNSKRKSLRVVLPLQVEIDGNNYPVSNWSTTGIGVEQLGDTLQSGEIVQARLHLLMPESTLSLAVELEFRDRHGDVAGFDFHDLSPSNKRVLRHYIEMSVDGRLADVESMVGLAAAPARYSPIDAPLNAVTLGAPAVHGGAGRWRSLAVLSLALLFAVAIGALLFYNFAWRVEGTGFVSGSVERVTANYDGRVSKIWVEPNTYVQAGAPLFALENPALKTEIESMERHLQQLVSEQGRSARARVNAEASLLSTLKNDSTLREREMANAQHLYEQGIISQRDLMQTANAYADVRNGYMRQVADSANRTLSLEAVDVVDKLRQDIVAKKQLMAGQEAAFTVRAPRKGKVFNVEKVAGEYVAAHDPVLLLESDTTPSVLLRLPNDDALKLRLGMPAEIYVPFEDRKYPARVGAIGLAAVSANSPVTLEGGLNETLVKLEFDDKQVRLPANSRVNVWVKTWTGLHIS